MRGADESDRPLPEAEIKEAVISAQEAADARIRPAARSAAESRSIESQMPVFSTEGLMTNRYAGTKCAMVANFR